MKRVKHTTIRNGNLFCLNCGGEHVLKMPIGINEMVKKIRAFNVLHADCEERWMAPQADLSRPVHERMTWWLRAGERGSSSNAIFSVISGMPLNSCTDHPYDLDDFRRCYLLLKVIPEWKGELAKMKTVSHAWSCLVSNWDELTKMLEEQLTGGKNEMDEVMQALIN